MAMEIAGDAAGGVIVGIPVGVALTVIGTGLALVTHCPALGVSHQRI